MPQRIAVILGLLLFVASPGCGGKRQLAEVKGRVTHNGKPLKIPNCQITFMSKQQRVFIAAPIKDDGTYRVSMAEGYGLPPGKYKVGIAPLEGYNPGTDAMSEEVARKLLDSAIPKKYQSHETSGLELELTPQGAEFDVDMKDP